MADLIPSQGRVLVDFHADWCGPCQMLGKVLDEIDTVPIVKISIDDHPEIASSYGVRGVPTLLILDDGRVTAQRVGAMPKSAVEQWLNSVA